MPADDLATPSKIDGSLWCIGENPGVAIGGDGNLLDATEVPVQVSLPATALGVDVSDGSSASCALLADSSVRCWGWTGLLGHESGKRSKLPVKVAKLNQATGVSLGHGHACAIQSDGSAWCWGSNYCGVLGGAGTGNLAEPTPRTVRDLKQATSIDAGEDHSCAVTADGAVRCWGRFPLEGQMAVLPDWAVPVAGLAAAVSVSLDLDSYALHPDGTVSRFLDSKSTKPGYLILPPKKIPGLAGVDHPVQDVAALGRVRAWLDELEGIDR